MWVAGEVRVCLRVCMGEWCEWSGGWSGCGCAWNFGGGGCTVERDFGFRERDVPCCAL
jgi:hypothetical protein